MSNSLLKFVPVLISFLAISLESAFAQMPDYNVMSQSFGESYARGRKAQAKGDYAEAAQEYSKSIETQPQAMQLYMFRAGCYVALKKNKEALADVATYQDLLKKSVDKNDKSILSTVALMQARAYDGLGRTKDALKSYKQSIALRDDLPETHHQLGDFYRRNGQPELALDELVKYRDSLGSRTKPEFKAEINEMIQQVQREIVKKNSPKKIKSKGGKHVTPD